MKYILGNHWTEAPKGWITLKEEDQDITKRFQWEDNSVDALLSCHVLEHVDLIGGINYFKESFRVLKPTGILRTICPTVDKLSEYTDDGILKRNYVKTSLAPYYKAEAAALDKLGLDLLDFGKPFIHDSLMKKHDHKFLWSVQLMKEVMWRIGFTYINECHRPGTSDLDMDTCLERKVRGIEIAYLADLGVKVPPFWDCESSIIEASK